MRSSPLSIIFCLFKLVESTERHATFATLSYNKSELIRELVTPFMGYFVCDYFLGNEMHEFADIAAPTAQQLTTAEDAEKIKAGDLVYVQVSLLEMFVAKYLQGITARFLLVTGQWREPYLTLDQSVDRRYMALKNSDQISTAIMNNRFVVHWFMQNPHIEHEKVGGIPYGIFHGGLEAYANALRIRAGALNKTSAVALTYFSATHWSRAPLIEAAKKKGIMQAGKVDPPVFYKMLAESYFVFSPVGDRPDCYRHWESIGLGALPICNCPHAYIPLFRDNMLFVAHSDFSLLAQLSDTWALSTYHVPNRRLVLVAHWRQHFEDTRRKLGFRTQTY